VLFHVIVLLQSLEEPYVRCEEVTSEKTNVICNTVPFAEIIGKRETKSGLILYCLEFNKGPYTTDVAAELTVNRKIKYSRLIAQRERERSGNV
jgi:hypothetical protein